MKIEFNLSDKKIDETLIGAIYIGVSKLEITNEEIFNRIKQGTKNIIDIDASITDFCTLQNNVLAAVDCSQRSIILFDGEFKQIKKIDNIDNKEISPLFITTNNSSRLYISEYLNSRVLVTDLNLNKIRHFDGKIDNIQLNNPFGICFHKNIVYLCDLLNSRIVKFTQDLDVICAHKIEIKPQQIKIVNKTACVRAWNDDQSIYFYHLDDFKTVKFKCQIESAILSELNSNIFIYSSKKSVFYCYDQNDTEINKINSNLFGTLKVDFLDPGMVYFNNHLVMASRYSKKLILF